MLQEMYIAVPLSSSCSIHYWVGYNELPPVVPVLCLPCCLDIAEIVVGLPQCALTKFNRLPIKTSTQLRTEINGDGW